MRIERVYRDPTIESVSETGECHKNDFCIFLTDRDQPFMGAMRRAITFYHKQSIRSAVVFALYSCFPSAAPATPSVDRQSHAHNNCEQHIDRRQSDGGGLSSLAPQKRLMGMRVYCTYLQ